MRILHTSDWHLGANLGPASRDDEHRAFLGWLRQTLRDEDVDVLVIAGDIFDHAQPSAEAQGLYYRFLASLRDGLADDGRGPRQVVVVGGNHDSPSRLDAPRDILGALRVSVVGGYDRDNENRLIVPVFGDRQGRDLVGVIAAVPYINEYRLGVSARDTDKRAAAVAAFTDLHSRLADRAAAEYPGVPLVATGHLTCSTAAKIAPAGASARGTASDDATISDDDFPQPIHNVGDLGALPPSIFDDRFSYVALGHIHRAFPPAAPRIWYSGTPVPVGFTELSPRRALLVDIPTSPGATASVRTLSIPSWRDLVRIEGPPDAVLARLENCRGDKALPPLVDVHAQVDHYDPTLRQKVSDTLRRIHTATGTAPVLVNLRQSSLAARTAAATGQNTIARDRALTPVDVFRLGWTSKHGSPPSPDILEAFESLRAAAAHRD